MPGQVIITGGRYSNVGRRVSVYNEQGWVEDWPSLNKWRYDHGCGHFINSDNKLVGTESNYLLSLFFTMIAGLPGGGRVSGH